jgi:hypothetical protein
MAYNVQLEKNKIKLLIQYESVTQRVSFGNAVFAALMSGKIYDVIPQNGDCSTKTMCVLWVFETKSVIKTQRRYRTRYGKDPPSVNAIRRWLKQFAAIERVTPQMLENTWKEIEYSLDILRATKGAYVEVV